MDRVTSDLWSIIEDHLRPIGGPKCWRLDSARIQPDGSLRVCGFCPKHKTHVKWDRKDTLKPGIFDLLIRKYLALTALGKEVPHA